MTLPKLAATRPVTSFMVLMTTVVLGSISATRLPQEFFPKLAIPFVAVVVPYPNSNPTKIEKTIARPLEEVLATLPDVKRLRSNSDADTCERWGCRFGRQGSDRSGTRSGVVSFGV